MPQKGRRFCSVIVKQRDSRFLYLEPLCKQYRSTEHLLRVSHPLTLGEPFVNIYTMISRSFFLLCLTYEAKRLHAFVLPQSRGVSWQLHAKKVPRKKNADRSGGGGFGGSGTATKSKSVNKSDEKDNYAVFPALEPHILETLVPAPEHWQTTAGPLPEEVLDRLHQIYGFGNFNNRKVREHQNEKQQESSSAGVTSLEDLLMIDSSLEEDEDSTDASNTEHLTLSQQIMKDAIEALPPFTDFRILHIDPLVLAVDNFMSADECREYLDLAGNDDAAVYSQTSPTVGKGAAARAQRTSTTWYHSYEKVPTFLTKACALLGLSNADGWEEVQMVRYRKGEEFTWHLDALAEDNLPSAGQRVATLLLYLTETVEGGATLFRDLNLGVEPKVGTALLFFPAAGGIPGEPADFRTLHSGEVVAPTSPVDKWIGQIWLRPRPYHVTVGMSHEGMSRNCFDSFALRDY